MARCTLGAMEAVLAVNFATAFSTTCVSPVWIEQVLVGPAGAAADNCVGKQTSPHNS